MPFKYIAAVSAISFCSVWNCFLKFQTLLWNFMKQFPTRHKLTCKFHIHTQSQKTSHRVFVFPALQTSYKLSSDLQTPQVNDLEQDCIQQLPSLLSHQCWDVKPSHSWCTRAILNLIIRANCASDASRRLSCWTCYICSLPSWWRRWGTKYEHKSKFMWKSFAIWAVFWAKLKVVIRKS